MQPIDATFWRDITSPNRADLEALAINDLVIDDILHGGQRTKIERYADGVFFVFMRSRSRHVMGWNLSRPRFMCLSHPNTCTRFTTAMSSLFASPMHAGVRT
jgi:Mg2+ and Co2+ transporter CorA